MRGIVQVRGGSGGGSPYGAATAPAEPGSAGYTYITSYGGSGGGVIRIEATGLVTVNGLVAANGGNTTAASGGVVRAVAGTLL